MSHLLNRRRGHDSEDDDDESVISGITTDFDDDEEDFSDDYDQDSQEEEEESDYDSDEKPGEEADKDSDDEIVLELKEKVIQDTTTKSDSIEHVNNETDQPPVIEVSTTTEIDYEELQQQEKEKTVHELREYRRKLAEDPSFVPYVGLFWGHDDRYREDSLAETRESAPQFSNASASVKKPSYDRNLDPLMHKKWDHSGYEELLRLDEQDERRKRELLESGQSPINERPNRSRYNNNGYNGGGGRGRGSGRGGRGGYFQQHQQNRHGNFQKRSNNEEWPHVSTSNTNTIENVGNTVDQLSSDIVDKPKMDAWGSIDRVEEIEPIVKSENNEVIAADGWGATPTAKSSEGWGASSSTSKPKTQEEATLTTTNFNTGWGNSPNKNQENSSNNGWGSLTESNTTDGWKTQSTVESNIKESERSTTSISKGKKPKAINEPEILTNYDDTWSAPPATTESKIDWGVSTSMSKSSSTDGWGKQPTSKDVDNNNWKTDDFSSINVNQANTDIDNSTILPIKQEEINTIPEKDACNASVTDVPSAFSAATNNGWGKQEETSMESSWSTNESKDWKKPHTKIASKWDTTTNSDDSRKDSGGWNKHTPQKEKDIPSEEKASSSWANVKPDVEVYTTPSDFSKIVYTKTHDRFDSPRRNNYQQQEDDLKSKSPVAVKQNWDQKATTVEHQPSDNWATSSSDANVAEWTSVENVATNSNVQDGWAAAPITQPKSEDISKGKFTFFFNIIICAKTLNNPIVENNWEKKSVSEQFKDHVEDTSSWNAPAETSTKPKSSNWNESTAFDQTNSSSPSSVRGGWSNSRSNNSTNWNADREWNNKIRNEQQPQHKTSRGYFSTKVGTDVPESNTDETRTPETSAWGNFQSTGDDDSDVEIILEAEEEPEWLKDEQVLGMTSPGELDQPNQPSSQAYSPRMVKPYLQHDSGQSSPRPEYSRKSNGRSSKPRRNFDENWRQREEPEAFRPMFYPPPHHHPHPPQINGNITYVPMIPNGNGNPMYAMPFPMGSPSAAGGSASPPHGMENSSNTTSPSHLPHKFYTPSSPNVQLPPGYEANGMVYYGMDPSAMYPQPFYYYAPPQPMMSNNEAYNDEQQHHQRHVVRQPSLSSHHVHDEEGWGPTPENVETEEQWATKSPPNDFQNRKQPVNHNSYYFYSQQNHY